MTRPGEFTLIETYLKPLAPSPGAFALADDAACLPELPSGETWVVTQDALCEGVHFLPSDPPDLIARKALRVNLSDLVAKGAQPICYFLTLGLPPDWSPSWMEAFANGLATDQKHFNVCLMGGDTIRMPQGIMLSITAMGSVPVGQIVRRDTARAGEALYVTGTIGDAALGLLCLSRQKSPLLPPEHARKLIRRYHLPEPRKDLCDGVRTCASAALDISDGFLADLMHVLRASGLGAVLFCDQIPLSEAAGFWVTHDPSLFETCLTGGDDYEILLSIAPEQVSAFEARARAAGVRVTRVGRLTAKTSVEAQGRLARFLPKGGRLGYTHF